jgi:hypothetical protein
MRDAGPALGVVLGIALIAANIGWPSEMLVWTGIGCVAGSMLAGAVLHPLSPFERARVERSLDLNARAQAADGYRRSVGRLIWGTVRRFWIVCTLGIVVSVFLLRVPPQSAWAGWSSGAALALAGALLIGTLNHIFSVRRARSLDAGKSASVSREGQ